MTRNSITEQDIPSQMHKLKMALKAFPKESANLATQIEAASKHLPAYLKILKGHLGQLQRVLSLEAHHRTTLEPTQMVMPIQQLIALFEQVEPEDIALLESMTQMLQEWPRETLDTQIPQKVQPVSLVEGQ